MDLLSEWWMGFTEWWATIDWGDAPGWVGAFLTSGSLILALFVLRKELRRNRMTEIGKVVARYRILTQFDSTKLEVTAYNANEHPIAVVTFLYWGGLIWHRVFLKNPAGTPDLPPTAEGTASISWAFPAYPTDKNALISITDSTGTVWYRGVETGRIYSQRTVRRWLKRGRWMRLKERVQFWLSKRKEVRSVGADVSN